MSGDRYDYTWSDEEEADRVYADPRRERLDRLNRDRTGYHARTRCIACGMRWAPATSGLCYQTLECRA